MCVTQEAKIDVLTNLHVFYSLWWQKSNCFLPCTYSQCLHIQCKSVRHITFLLQNCIVFYWSKILKPLEAENGRKHNVCVCVLVHFNMLFLYYTCLFIQVQQRPLCIMLPKNSMEFASWKPVQALKCILKASTDSLRGLTLAFNSIKFSNSLF